MKKKMIQRKKKYKNNIFRSSHQRCSLRKGFLRNFTKFAGKHLCQSLFLIKLQASVCNFVKKETLAQVLSYEFCEISKNTFFTEYLWATASAFCMHNVSFALQTSEYNKKFTISKIITENLFF